MNVYSIIQIDAAHRQLKAQGRDPATVASLEHVATVQGKMLRTQVKSFLELTTERRTKALKQIPPELARVLDERHPAPSACLMSGNVAATIPLFI